LLILHSKIWRPQGDSNPCCRCERGIKKQFSEFGRVGWSLKSLTKRIIYSIPLHGNPSTSFPYFFRTSYGTHRSQSEDRYPLGPDKIAGSARALLDGAVAGLCARLPQGRQGWHLDYPVSRR